MPENAVTVCEGPRAGDGGVSWYTPNMNLRRISPQEAQGLLSNEGYAYVDVRSVPEFGAGHPTGAYNVPILQAGPGGMAPNPDFLKVMEANFPKDAKIVVGCKMGGRSMKAATLLIQAGYTDVVDQRAGFEGVRDSFGQMAEPGWRPAGLNVSTEAEPGKSYDDLKS